MNFVDDATDGQEAEIDQGNEISSKVSQEEDSMSWGMVHPHSPGGVVILGCHSEKRP